MHARLGPASAVLAVVGLVWITLMGACGKNGDSQPPDEVVGRVMSIDHGRLCVSPDRGASQQCTAVGEAGEVEGIEVGECVRLTGEPSAPKRQFEAVPNRSCAGADLGG